MQSTLVAHKLFQLEVPRPAVDLTVVTWFRREPPQMRPRVRGATPLVDGGRVLHLERWRHAARVLEDNQNLPLRVSVEAPPGRRLPFPEWHERARCRGMANADAIFFGAEPGARPTLTRSDVKRAQRICRPCPVARECLTHALTKPELYGMWAGTSGRHRERLWVLIEGGATVEQVVESCLAA